MLSSQKIATPGFSAQNVSFACWGTREDHPHIKKTSGSLRPKVGGNAHVFEASSLAAAPLYLDEDSLLLVALLAGGDYDHGVPGCGARIAHGLARHGLGRSLRELLVSYSGTLREKHLATWRNTLREELRSDSGGFLGRTFPKVADNVSDKFPDPKVIELYTNPLTSWSSRYTGPVPNVSIWIPCEPKVHEISVFCKEHFSWDTPYLSKKFASLLWSGIAFRMISSV